MTHLGLYELINNFNVTHNLGGKFRQGCGIFTNILSPPKYPSKYIIFIEFLRFMIKTKNMYVFYFLGCFKPKSEKLYAVYGGKQMYS